MNTIKKLGIVLCAAAALSYAESWSGKLVDAGCYDRKVEPGQDKNTTESCAATQTTTSFGIQTADGKVHKLDASGNAKASTFIQSHRDAKDLNVMVSGSMDGQTVKVDSIEMPTAPSAR